MEGVRALLEASGALSGLKDCPSSPSSLDGLGGGGGTPTGRRSINGGGGGGPPTPSGGYSGNPQGGSDPQQTAIPGVGPHRLGGFPGMEYNLGKGGPDGLNSMYDIPPHFVGSNYQPPSFNNGHLDDNMDSDYGGVPNNRHQMMNNRLKSLIQSRQNQKDIGLPVSYNSSLQPGGVLTELGNPMLAGDHSHPFSNMHHVPSPLTSLSQSMGGFPPPHLMANDMGSWNSQPTSVGATKEPARRHSRSYSRGGSESGFNNGQASQQSGYNNQEESGNRVNGVNYGAFFASDSAQDGNGKSGEDTFDGSQNNTSTNNAFSPSSSNSSSAQSFQPPTHHNNNNGGQQQQQQNSAPRPFSPSFGSQKSPYASMNSRDNGTTGTASATSNGNVGAYQRQTSPRLPPEPHPTPNTPSSPRVYGDSGQSAGGAMGRPPSTSDQLVPGGNSAADSTSNAPCPDGPAASAAATVATANNSLLVESANETQQQQQPFLSSTTTSMNTFTSITNTYNLNTLAPSSSSSLVSLPSVSHLFGSNRLTTTLAGDAQEPKLAFSSSSSSSLYPSASTDNSSVSNSINNSSGAPLTGGGLLNSIDGGRIVDSRGGGGGGGGAYTHTADSDHKLEPSSATSSSQSGLPPSSVSSYSSASVPPSSMGPPVSSVSSAALMGPPPVHGALGVPYASPTLSHGLTPQFLPSLNPPNHYHHPGGHSQHQTFQSVGPPYHPGFQEPPGWWERLERLRNNTKLDAPPCDCYGNEEQREYNQPQLRNNQHHNTASLPAAT